jgi:hypothetical protein
MKSSMLVRFALFGSTFVADVSYLPGTPGTQYASNGDPGDPPEASECEINSLLHVESDKLMHNCTHLLATELLEQIMEAVETAADEAAAESRPMRRASARTVGAMEESL